MHLARRVPARSTALLLFVFSVTISAAAPSAPADRNEALSRITIENFGIVNDAYYRGAQPVGRDYADLAAAGIKTVIDLQRDFDPSEEAAVEQAGMKFYRFRMTTHNPPDAATIQQFLAIVNNPANQPVYVHCKGGRHRTGVMTALVRMTNDGWTADQAYQEMKKFDFGPSFLHPEFKRFVYEYYGQFERSRATAASSAH